MVAFSACSSDDDGDGLGNKDAGSENKTDVAVTGAVQERGVQYAVLTGYVNLNVIASGVANCRIGIQYGRTNDDYDPGSADWGGREYARDFEGNKLTVTLNGLAADQEWNYRTFVYTDGHYYFGETKTFETKDFENIATTGNVSELTSSSAVITCSVDTLRASWLHEDFDYNTRPEVGVAWSKEKRALSDQMLNDPELDVSYGYRSVRLQSVEDNTYTCTLSYLDSNTTYYYCSYTCVGYTYRGGSIKSFKTQP